MEDNYFKDAETISTDPSNYSYGKNEGFRYLRVQELYTKCSQSLSEEMVEGFWEQKVDKFGNTTSVYHPDQRLKVKEAVLTFVSIMRGDIAGTDFETAIDTILTDISKYYENVKKGQNDFWENMNIEQRTSYMKNNPRFIPQILNSDSPFYQQFLNECVEGYRLIFEQLELALREQTKYLQKQSTTVGGGKKDGSS